MYLMYERHTPCPIHSFYTQASLPVQTMSYVQQPHSSYHTPYLTREERPSDEQASYKTLEEATALILQSIQSEREDELFYDYLLSVAPDQEARTIITSIRDDERRHNKMFRSLYQKLTGRKPAEPTSVDFTKPASYELGLTQALQGELNAVKKYRDIRAGLPNRYERDMLMEIMTDELRHASLYNYLYTRAKTSR